MHFISFIKNLLIHNMVWPVGFEPTKAAGYTQRPVLNPGYGPGESFANLLTTTVYYITDILVMQDNTG